MKQRLTIAEILPPVLLALVLAPAAMHTGSLFAQYSTPHGVDELMKTRIGYGYALAIESCVLMFVFSGMRWWDLVFAGVTTVMQLIYFQTWMHVKPWLKMSEWRPVLAELAFALLTGVLSYAFSSLTARNMQRRAQAQQTDAERKQRDAEYEQMVAQWRGNTETMHKLYKINEEKDKQIADLKKQLEQKENKRRAGRARWAKDTEQKEVENG